MVCLGVSLCLLVTHLIVSHCFGLLYDVFTSQNPPVLSLFFFVIVSFSSPRGPFTICASFTLVTLISSPPGREVQGYASTPAFPFPEHPILLARMQTVPDTAEKGTVGGEEAG